MKSVAAPKNIDEYIAGFPAEVQEVLQKIRMTIREAAPEATEKISYQMPTFYLNGNLVHFAAFKEHIGFYPVPTGIEKFKKELSVFKQGKGSVQFPLDQPMPYALITKIVKFRLKENLAKPATKAKRNRSNGYFLLCFRMLYLFLIYTDLPRTMSGEMPDLRR